MATYSEHIAQVSTALADPTRRGIMEYLLFSDSPLSVQEVAEHFGLHANAARMHLDKLARGGLLRIVRRRGERGGRPANLYGVSGEDWELNLPPRMYKLLADVLARGISGCGEKVTSRIGEEAFIRGREEAAAGSSTLARLPLEADMRNVAQAWWEEIARRGHKAELSTREDGLVEMRFLTCPFGELSRNHPGLVCDIHRRLEEGLLSLAGRFRLDASAESCLFILRANGKQDRSLSAV